MEYYIDELVITKKTTDTQSNRGYFKYDSISFCLFWIRNFLYN